MSHALPKCRDVDLCVVFLGANVAANRYCGAARCITERVDHVAGTDSRLERKVCIDAEFQLRLPVTRRTHGDASDASAGWEQRVESLGAP